jgi:hypothetical protein
MLGFAIRTAHKGEALSPGLLAEYDWLHENRQALYEQYGECCVLVYQQQVIGHGQNLDAALAEAEAKLSHSIAEEIHPIIGLIYPAHRPPNRYFVSDGSSD